MTTLIRPTKAAIALTTIALSPVGNTKIVDSTIFICSGHCVPNFHSVLLFIYSQYLSINRSPHFYLLFTILLAVIATNRYIVIFSLNSFKKGKQKEGRWGYLVLGQINILCEIDSPDGILKLNKSTRFVERIILQTELFCFPEFSSILRED